MMNGIQPNQYTRCHRCYWWEYGYCHFQRTCPKKTKPDEYCPDYVNREKSIKEFGELEVHPEWRTLINR